MIGRGRWTQTHITDLRAGLRNGLTVEAMAAALDRAPDDVRGMMDRLRLTPQSLAAE